MNTKDARDRSIDEMLRQSFQSIGDAAGPGPSCLDAETLAAWAEGRLSASSLATVESHLSACARCQRIVGVLAKLPAFDGAPERRWNWAFTLRWFVPLAAGAAAIALWIAVPGREVTQSTVPSRQSTVGSPQSTVESPPPAIGGQQSAAGSQSSEIKAQPAAPAESRVQAKADERALKDEKAETAADNLGRVTERASAPPSAPAPAAPTLNPEAAAGARTEAFSLARQTGLIAQEITSPTPSIRWRVGPRGLLQYSASGGAAWEQLSIDVGADLVAGASPSPSVCWVVGRSGVVLLTVDGRRFNRVPFPANVDLAAVRATDARNAVVTTSDGRMFSTSDGGSTWTP